MTKGVDRKKAVLIAIAIATAYFVLVQLVLLWPIGAGDAPEKLGSNDIIALAGGMLTAAGLSALWLQLAAASEAEADRSAAAALRFDELHMEFNSPEIRVMRDLGWHYLKFITANPTRLTKFARWWVLSQDKAPEPPATLLSDAGLEHLAPKRLADYTWALSTMVAFFVRIANRLNAYDRENQIDQDTLRVSIGPFFWDYWEPYLLLLSDACDRVFDEKREGLEPPYFSKPLDSLATRFPERVAAREAKAALAKLQKEARLAAARKARSAKTSHASRTSRNPAGTSQRKEESVPE